jgi:hypothetical protein
MDRRQAAVRANLIYETLKGISFDKAASKLTAQTLALSPEAPEEYRQELLNNVQGLREKKDIDSEAKALLLGLTILNFTGPDVLRAAVDSLGDEIREVSKR